MAKIIRRTWTAKGPTGHRVKRVGFGFTTMVDDPTAPSGRARVKRFNADWRTREDAQHALDAFQLTGKAAQVARERPPDLTLGEAFERYLHVKARNKSQAGERRYAIHLMAEFGATTLLTQLTAARISEYKAKRLAITTSKRGGPLSAAAINRPLALLRALLRLAHEEWELLPTVPKIRPEKEAQGRLRWLTPEETRTLLAACRAQKNPALVDLLELALYTGMRQGELLGLTWDRVDRARGVVLLELTKNGRRREVPLNGPADAVLARRMPDIPGDTPSSVPEAGTPSGSTGRPRPVAAKLADFLFHDLRHTFASWAMQRGATLPELQALLGHSSLAMVMRYSHLAPEHRRSAVAKLDDVLMPEPVGPKMAQSSAPDVAETADARGEKRGIKGFAGAGGGS